MQKSRVLVVEDELEINNLIKDALSKEGLEVMQAFDGKEAMDCFNPCEISLVILDVMLPYIDGMEVLRRIRESSTVHVIILSAKGSESDRIIGLGVGADDYMTKPFSVAELTARVKAHLRRCMYYDGEKTENEIIRLGDIALDLGNYKLIKRDEHIELTSKEFEILKLFFSNPNRVFTKAQIFNNVWNDDYMHDDNTVMVHIRRLRNKIEDNPDEPKFIQTVWGIGYKLGEVQ